MRGKLSKIVPWLAVFFATVSLLLVMFVKVKHVFDNGNTAAFLLRIAIVGGIFGIIFGFISLPRWQAIISLLTVALIGYLLFFTPLYMIP